MFDKYDRHIQTSESMQLGKPLSIRAELEVQIKYHLDEMTKKQEMLNLLDQNPAIEKFINLSR